MAKIMGLKDQIEIQKEMEKRRTECRHRGGMIKYQIQLQKDEYDKFVQSHPHLFQKVNQIIKRKKNLTTNKGASKKQKYADSDSENYRNADEEDELSAGKFFSQF